MEAIVMFAREARGKNARGKERSRGRARARGEPAPAGDRSFTRSTGTVWQLMAGNHAGNEGEKGEGKPLV